MVLGGFGTIYTQRTSVAPLKIEINANLLSVVAKMFKNENFAVDEKY
ncbi:MAG: hypothetical protein PG978_000686 [Wolbachia endosymbiont of Ctenocephalides felis wCfeF]|nr:MAG: hypothetical protein PG978_000686 [Wolbachia endosymbiont of Ctenocephalides felis wCfeF]